jgi:hypothetical protein
VTQRREKLENTSHLLLNVSTCDDNPKHMKMVIFYPVIEKYFSTIDETLVMNELEEHFLINQNFTVQYFPNTDIIHKLNTAHSCFLFFFLYTSQGMTALFRK